ncbi:MAG: DUF2238 domain-containing protein [Planctomycetota bacterium]
MKRFPLPQALVTATIVIPSLVVAVVNRNAEFAFYATVTVVLGVVIYVAHRRTGFPSALLWLLVGWAALHMAGGLLYVPEGLPALEPRVWYNFWFIPGYLKYDNVIHAYGFGVTAWACWCGLKSLGITRPTFGTLLLTWTAAQGFGACNEIVEFTATLLVEETNVGDFNNAMWDLVANATGALIACLAIAGFDRRT